MTAKKKSPRHRAVRGGPWLERGETEPPQGLADQMDLWINQPDGDSNVRKLPDEFQDLILVTELERSIAASSQVTMTARDPGRALFKAGYFSSAGRPDLLMDGLWFRAVLYEKTQADEFKIQFEDREIAIARQYRKPYTFKAHGEVNPRASFIKNLLRKAVPHAPFFCPDLLHERARIKPIKSKEKKPLGPHQKAELKRARQITHSYTIEGRKADAQQRANIETLLEVADNLNAPATVRVALICAGIGESTLHSDGPGNLNSKGYWGVLQGRSRQTSEGPGYWPNRYDSKGMAEAFLRGGKGFKSAIQLYKEGVTDPGAIAEKAEGSGAGSTFYSKHADDARAIIAEYSGSEHSSAASRESTGGTERTHQGQPQDTFKFPRSEEKEGDEPESAWECALSYANELNWRLFCRAGRFYLVSDDYLKKNHAITIEEDDPGIIDVKWTIDLASRKKNPPHLELEARAHLWQAAPGETVTFRGLRQGRDIHEGIWIVSDIHRPDITDNAVTITLERPAHPLAETALEVQPSVNMPGAPTPPKTRDGGSNPGGLGPGLRLPAASIAYWEHNLAQNHPETHSRIRWVVARILAGFEEYKNTPKKLYISSTNQGNHVSGSYHYKGEAMDLASQNGDQKFMDTVGAWIEQYLRSYLTEGIHNPTLSVKYGKHVDGPSTFAAHNVWNEHKDHIHIAVAENAPLERGQSGAFGGAGILGG